MLLFKTLGAFFLSFFVVSNLSISSKRTLNCPFILDTSSMPAMVLRIENKSNLPRDIVDQCLNRKLTKIETIAIVDRVSETEFLEEMKRQSSLPIKPESVIQIGKLLAPDHLLVLTDEMIKISNIESGKLLFSISLSFDPLSYSFEKHFVLIVRSVIFLPIFILIYYVLYLFFLPIQKKLKRIEDNEKANRLLMTAKESLSINNIRTASEKLVKCARMGKGFKASREADQILRNIIRR